MSDWSLIISSWLTQRMSHYMEMSSQLVSATESATAQLLTNRDLSAFRGCRNTSRQSQAWRFIQHKTASCLIAIINGAFTISQRYWQKASVVLTRISTRSSKVSSQRAGISLVTAQNVNEHISTTVGHSLTHRVSHTQACLPAFRRETSI